ncbi:MAG: hypothetical protein WD876_03475 [Candidatus Pacearchaeota archaeon]
MGLFGFGKKNRVVDWSEGYTKTTTTEKKEEPSDTFNIVSNANSGQNAEDEGDAKKKLAKRLLDITNKLDDISNQIYHLQQRVELLERKTGVRAGVQ